MKKQFLNFAAVVTIVCFTACKSSTLAVTSTESTAAKSETKRGKRPNAGERFARLDTNSDGRISIQEVKGPMKQNFAKIDTDGNGFISKEELRNAPKPKRRPRNN